MFLQFRHRLSQAALVVSTLAVVWALVVFLTGGIVIDAGPVRISSRRALNPAIAGVLLAIVAFVAATPIERTARRRAFAEYLRGRRSFDRAPRAAMAVAIAASLAVASFGLARGLFVAAASDAYGYVSQADLWARGQIIVRQPWARAMTWHGADWSLAPLGYRPIESAPHGTDIVPTYSPGVPILMAVFKLAAGPRAVYYVVPILGALAVFLTYVMGRRLAGPFTGAAAAVLLATSPTFLFEVTAPASDVAATAWWALALAALTYDSRRAALGAGVAAGVAILTRPNLVPLAAVLAAPMLARAWRSRASPGRPHAAWRAAAFAAGVTPACLFIAWLNSRLYGSPFSSGYGSLNELYAWSNGWTNLDHYVRWLVDTQTPIVLLAVAAPLLVAVRGTTGQTPMPRGSAVMWCGAVLCLLALYLFYVPFEEWWYLRFLMPMFPALFALTSVIVVGLAASVARVVPVGRDVVATIIIGALAWHGLRLAIDRGAPQNWEAEQRYLVAGDYVRTSLPERAAVVAWHHSGSARFYSGRVTVRYDALRDADLDVVMDELRRLGYRPYLLLDEFEEADFRRRFAEHSALGALDWAPKATLFRGVVRVYDPEERSR